MRDLEIDMTDPYKPVLWVKGKAIKMYGWKKIDPRSLISSTGHSGRKKESAKSFYKDYGVPASVCAKYLNAGLIKMSVGAVEEHKELCYRQGRFSSFDTIQVCEMKDELDQALADGIRNITPFIALLKMNPKQLKEHFGSANWKAICKNSFSRNKGIVQSYVYVRPSGHESREGDITIESLLKTPSTILKYKNLAEAPEVATYLNKKCNFSIDKIRKMTTGIYRASRIVRDTQSMAEQYEQPFSFDWSWRKMQEKHGEYSKIALVKEYERLKDSDPKYAETLREGKQVVWELDGVKATFLDTYIKILEEGAHMGHCVGSYARSCYHNTYAVVHMSGDGEESTLGMFISQTDGHYSIQQHYGKFNEELGSEKHKKLADYVVEFLNNENIDEKIYKLQHP